jgi:phytoene/squalene synthetase
MFNEWSNECSKQTTQKYSTSFSSAVNLLQKDIRQHIHNIYGFVRLADEIVDTFHDYDKATLLDEFKKDTYAAIERKISLNPILNSFQHTVNYYGIEFHLVDSFLSSMETDLYKSTYQRKEYEQYIYGSAEVVGLMCLSVFCDGEKRLFNQLIPAAKALGAAFQKVNFLRDIKADNDSLSRMYFPKLDIANFTRQDKLEIEQDIQNDFDAAYQGVLQLPERARFGVYVAYKYYYSLFKKIKQLEPQKVLEQRIRIPDYGKVFIVFKAGLRNQFGFL